VGGRRGDATNVALARPRLRGGTGVDDAYVQTQRAIANIADVLERAGTSLKYVVRTRIYVTDIARWEEIGRAHGEAFRDVRPATSMVEVARLIDPAMLVEIEADAVIPE